MSSSRIWRCWRRGMRASIGGVPGRSAPPGRGVVRKVRHRAARGPGEASCGRAHADRFGVLGATHGGRAFETVFPLLR